MPFVSRTRATFRSAEFGFFGVVVYTRVQTPRRCGAATFFLRPLPDFRPGVASLRLGVTLPLRINWLVVGMRCARLAGATIHSACLASLSPAQRAASDFAAGGGARPSRWCW